MKTKELDKMAAVQLQARAIGDFLDWLGYEKAAHLATVHRHGPDCPGWDAGRESYRPRGDEYCDLRDGESVPLRYHREPLLAEYFQIDLDKVEDEKRALLESLRKGNP